MKRSHESGFALKVLPMVMTRPILMLACSLLLAAACSLAIFDGMAEAQTPAITLESLLQEMVDRDALARWSPSPYDSAQWSSYNRASVAPNQPGWFADSDGAGYLRTEQNDGRTEWVLMDQDGPGAVTRIWTPYFYTGGASNPYVGGPNVRFYLDGSSTPVIAEDMIGLVTGKSFVTSPLAYESVRAGDMYLPVPYAQSCKITVDKPPFYYCINSRAYAPGTNVESFTQANYQAASPVVAQVGNALSHPVATPGNRTVAGAGTIQPGGNLALSMPGGANAVRSLQICLPTDQPAALRSTVLQIAFDGQQTVRVPVGDLFSSSVRLNVFEDFARTVAADGTMTLRWVMPYQEKAQVTLLNTGGAPVTASVQATVGDWQWDDSSMYFHANFREEKNIPTSPIRDWNYATINGKGVYVGDSLTVYNPVAGWWGEGDEKIYVDGEAFPSHFGTGTEDYYGYAGGVLPDVATDIYSRPFHGQYQVACKEPGYNVLSRIRSLDAIPFQNQLKFDMEVSYEPGQRSPSNQVDFAVATFWYGMPGVAIPPGIYDHFDGATVNTALWNVETDGGTATQANSVVTLASPGGDWISLYSQTAVADHYGTYEFKIGETFTGGRNYFGFNDGTNKNVIYIYGSGDAYKLSVIVGEAWNGDPSLTTATAPQAGDIYTIVWLADGIDVYINGVLDLHEDLSPNPMDGALKYRLLSGWGTTGGTMGIDYVGEQVVPEPGTLALLGAALIGLLCYAWWKRR